MTDLTHLDEKGRARMVDVGEKPITRRSARAEAFLRAGPDVVRRLMAGDLPKGDALAAARIAGTLAAKRVDELIPLCHTLALEAVAIDIAAEADGLRITAETRLHAKTGAEMEALTAATLAALTLYDMGKALDRAMVIEGVRLLEKDGGKSGHYAALGEKR